MTQRSLIYPIFLPMLGCRHRCIYCDQNKISGADSLDLNKELANVSRFIANHPQEKKEIAFYGSSFTALHVDFREMLLQQFHKVVDANTQFRISTHPLYIDDEILSSCQKGNIAVIELGIQDFCDEVLHASGRGYSGKQAVEAAKLVQAKGFVLGVQLMPGLPGSNEESIRLSMSVLHKLKPAFIRLYPLIVIKGTPLAELYGRGDYVPLDLDEAVHICADYAEFAEAEGINIIKMGLPSNIDKDEILGGPYHPAFGEYVNAERLLRRIMTELCAGKEIYLDKKQRLLLMGHRGIFWAKLQNRLGNCSLDSAKIKFLG